MSRNQQPWYLRAFVAISAWFTALFLLFWIGLAFGKQEGLIMVLGFVILASASFLARAYHDSDFLEQACLACGIAGRGAACWGMGDIFNNYHVAAGIMLLLEPLWFLLNPGYASRLIAGLFGFLFLAIATGRGWKDGTPVSVTLISASIVMPMSFYWAWGNDQERWQALWRPLGWASVLVLLGWSLASASLSQFGFLHQQAVSIWLLISLAAFVFGIARYDSIVLAAALTVLGALGWLMRQNPEILSAIFVGLLGFQLRREGMRRIAAVALLAAVSAYYYRMQSTLLHKAGVLALSGIVLGAGSAVLAPWFRSPRRGHDLSVKIPWRQLAAAGFLILIMAGVDFSAYQAEQSKSAGKEVFLEIQPRDPRDPLLGDYMALRFSLADSISAVIRHTEHSRPGEAWIRLDPRQVAVFDSLALGQPQPSGTTKIRFGVNRGRATFGMDKAYFQEGDEPRFRGARYGRFRLQEDGSLTWIGLMGEDLKPL